VCSGTDLRILAVDVHQQAPHGAQGLEGHWELRSHGTRCAASWPPTQTPLRQLVLPRQLAPAPPAGGTRISRSRTTWKEPLSEPGAPPGVAGFHE